MRIGRILGHTDTTILQHEIKVAEVVAHLLVGMLLQLQVVLQTLVRLDNFRHVTSRTKDTQQTALIVA